MVPWALHYITLYKSDLHSMTYRSVVKLFLDWAVWVAAAPLAYVMRLEGGFGDVLRDLTLYTLAGAALKGVLLLRSRHAGRSWHRTGLRDMFPLVGLVLIVTVLEVAIAMSSGIVFVPRSVPLIEAMLAVLGLASLRFAARTYYEERGVIGRPFRESKDRPRRVVVVGAGDSGTLVAREMMRHPDGGRRPVAFLDDDPMKASTSKLGIRVMGTVADLEAVVEEVEADEVLIAMPSAGERMCAAWSRPPVPLVSSTESSQGCTISPVAR